MKQSSAKGMQMDQIDLTELIDDVLTLIAKHGIDARAFAMNISVSREEYERLKSVCVQKPRFKDMNFIAVPHKQSSVQIAAPMDLKLKKDGDG